MGQFQGSRKDFHKQLIFESFHKTKLHSNDSISKANSAYSPFIQIRSLKIVIKTELVHTNGGWQWKLNKPGKHLPNPDHKKNFIHSPENGGKFRLGRWLRQSCVKLTRRRSFYWFAWATPFRPVLQQASHGEVHTDAFTVEKRLEKKRVSGDDATHQTTVIVASCRVAGEDRPLGDNWTCGKSQLFGVLGRGLGLWRDGGGGEELSWDKGLLGKCLGRHRFCHRGDLEVGDAPLREQLSTLSSPLPLSFRLHPSGRRGEGNTVQWMYLGGSKSSQMKIHKCSPLDGDAQSIRLPMDDLPKVKQSKAKHQPIVESLVNALIERGIERAACNTSA